MKKLAVPFILLLAFLCLPPVAGAGMIKAYFTGFAVTGAQNGDEMRTGLKTLLASQLEGALILAVDTPAEADIIVSGSYVAFGAVFSMDAVAKNSAGAFLGRAFVQGEGKGEFVPAVGKLAQDLAGQVRKAYAVAPAGQAAASPAP
jgi:hypothetical protein